MDALVVEHVFVTTREADETFAVANELLSRHGFTVLSASPTSQDAGVQSVEFFKKKERKSFRLHVALLAAEQKVRLDYDRGRVAVAASLQNLTADLGKSGRALVGGRIGKPVALQTEWLMSIARALESTITGAEPVVTAERQIVGARDACEAYSRKRTRNGCLGLLFLFIGVPILIGVIYAIVSVKW